MAALPKMNVVDAADLDIFNQLHKPVMPRTGLL
jgi:hypothetical protein